MFDVMNLKIFIYSVSVEFKDPVCILTSVDLFTACRACVNTVS